MNTKGVAAVLPVTSVNYPPELKDFEGWDEPKRILVILAHPDDPEFFCGATLIRWVKVGHEIRYCLLTNGQRGSQDKDLDPEVIGIRRKVEQAEAADFIGVKSIDYLGYMDGDLTPNLTMREQIVSVIRRYAPQIVVTSDPQNYVSLENRLNHPDHRAAGQITLDAAFPAAGNPQFYKEQIEKGKLLPVNPEEIWISATNQPNLQIDVTDYFDLKLEAISQHRSQIGDKAEFISRMRTRAITNEVTGKKMYLERFKRVRLK